MVMAPRIKLAEQPPLVTKDDFLSTYKSEDNHMAVAAADFLEERGGLPFTYLSPDFLNINALVSHILYSGSLAFDERSHRPQLVIQVPEGETGLLEEVVEELDTGLNRPPNSGNVQLSTNGSIYNRLMSKIPGMFVSEGSRKKKDSKASRPFTLPDYLTMLAKNYDRIYGTEEKPIATKALCDNLRILLATRADRSQTGLRYDIRLPSNRDIDAAHELAKSVVRLFNAVYPKIGFQEDSGTISLRHTKGKLFAPSLRMNKERVLNAISYYGLFEVNKKQTLHPYGRTTNYRERHKKNQG